MGREIKGYHFPNRVWESTNNGWCSREAKPYDWQERRQRAEEWSARRRKQCRG